MTRPGWSRIVVFASSLTACLHVPPGVPTTDDAEHAGLPPDLDRPWRKATTAHFELFSQLDDENTAGLVRILEQSRAVLMKVAWPLEARLPVSPVRVIAVWRLASFGAAPPGSFGGLAAWSVGVRELGRSNVIMINLDSEVPQYAGFTAAHEITHLILHLLEADQPLWLHEGLAAYFEALVFERERVTIGAVSGPRLRSLRRLQPVPVAKLFEWPVEPDDMETYSTFTDNAFLLVHYLMSEHHDRFREFQRLLVKGAAWRMAWDELFGPADQLAMDEQIRAYWDRRRLPTRDVEVVYGLDAPTRTTLASPADVHAVRAILFQQTRGPRSPDMRRSLSMREVRRSLALDAENRLAVEAGWPYFSREEARVRARMTWRAHPADWRAAILAARTASGAEAVTILESTRRLDELGALALAYWNVQRYVDALQVARVAVEREPADPFLLGAFAQCLIANDNCEAGRQAIAKGLAMWQSGGRLPFDLGWLNSTCAVK
jgi:hypothetical protein